MEFLEIAQNMDEKNKNEILSAFLEKKYTLSPKFDELQNFLNEHTDKDGYISDADAKVYDKMEENLKKELDIMNNKINNILNQPTSKPIFEQPINYNCRPTSGKFGIAGSDYKERFFDAVRSGFTAQNSLVTTTPASGGYLIPTSFYDEIVVELRSKNILREISTVIETQSTHDVVIQASAPVADWVSEGAAISLTTETFDKKSLGAHKLAVALAVSNEMLADSYFNISDHLAKEFGAAIALKEESAFFNGTGVNQPLGIITQMTASDTNIVSVTTAGASIATDDLISQCYKLGTEYRKNACWIMANSTLSAIRKLKDNNQAYIWQNQFSESTPPTLLGFPVHVSENIPAIAAGSLSVIFGDFSKFFIGQRGQMTFKPLYEVRSLNDETVFLMTERVDGILTDSKAVVGLKLKS